MKRSTGSIRGIVDWSLGLMLLGGGACSPGDEAPMPPGDATKTTTTETEGPSTTSPGPSLSSSGEGSDDSIADKSTAMTGVGEDGECNPYAQDCMEGLKCVPRFDDGGQIVNACVLVTGSATLGDPCTHEGVQSGADTCDANGMCFGELDFVSGWEGVCRRFCLGTPQVSECESLDEQCAGGLFPACLPRCDPLVQDCSGPEEGCYFRGAIDSFVCFVSSNEAGAGDNCQTGTSCSPGLQCRPAQTVVGCLTTNCCAEYCDTEEVGACDDAIAGMDCISIGAIEPQFENVGVCGIPQ